MIEINPDATFSTGNVSKMLGIEGLTAQRVKLLCTKGMVPYEMSSGTKQAHYQVRFGDFDKVIAAHNQWRTVNRRKDVVDMDMFAALEARVWKLERGLALENGVDLEAQA